MIYGITLVLLSLIAVPSLLLARKPDAAELLAKVAPYQGYLGLAFGLWGAWGIVASVLSLGLLTSAPVWWATRLAGSVVEATLGFLLAFPLVSRFLASDPASAARAAALQERLAPKQGQLGIFGLGVGAWVIVASILFV